MNQSPPSPGLSRNAKFAIVIIAFVVISPIVVVVLAVVSIRSEHVAPAPRTPAPETLAVREGSAGSVGGSGPSADHPGAAAYAVCAACHGAEGEGNALLGGPALAGQEPWYLERQLKHFKQGIRGSHPEDLYGRQMAPMAQTLADDAAIAAVSDYLAALPPVAEPEGNAGDVAKGQAHFMLCMACHGPEAAGVEAQGGPSLRNQHAWYLERQMANFKAGIRGTHPQDIHGQMMRPMALTMPDEAAIRDVVAYILSLQD